MAAVYANRGLVCSRSPQAGSAGIRVLLEGGNAFDAAIAVAAVEAVTVPPMCGLGGDAFAVLHHAASGCTISISGSSVAAAGATPAFYHARGYTGMMPLSGPLSVSVPGEVDVWETVHRRFGTRPFASLLEPAIGYAEEGFPLQQGVARLFAANVKNLTRWPSTAAVLTCAGEPYRAGDILVQRDLARSLRRVAQGGAEEFYRGALGRELAAALQQAGAPFELTDFSGHTTQVDDPAPSTTYRGRTVYETAVPSQGFLLLMMLNILEGFDLASLGHSSPEAVHLMVEAKKLAFADRNRFAGDPRFVDWPLADLLSKEHAARLRGRIDPARAAGAREPVPAGSDGNTSYFCIADGLGNTVSFIHSLSKGFGSDFIAPSTGILLNNRAGRGFTLQEGHPNVIAPGKRTMHTLNCYQVFQGGKPVLLSGTPGGDLQTQLNLQMITAIVDFGLTPQQAQQAPRWTSVPGTDPETLHRPFEIEVETSMPAATIAGLEALGHTVRPREGGLGGIVQLIALDHERGVMLGVSDPRNDGNPVGA